MTQSRRFGNNGTERDTVRSRSRVPCMPLELARRLEQTHSDSAGDINRCFRFELTTAIVPSLFFFFLQLVHRRTHMISASSLCGAGEMQIHEDATESRNCSRTLRGVLAIQTVEYTVYL